MATPNYEVDLNDKRLTAITNEEKTEINKSNATYDKMIGQSDKYYQDQINASKDYAKKQTQIQNEKTEFAIQEIEQQKAQTKKDYTKEQSGAYVDWQKQSNQYGAEAEQRAASGLSNTGYAESSLVSMYNTYQNRVVTAREAYQLAVQNYNNSITEARLQNNSVLAEIAHNALKQQLELSLQGFQHKNQLLLDKANKQLEIKQIYANEWKNMLDQINKENTLKEQARQADMANARQQEQIKIAQAELAIKQAAQKLDEEKFAYEKSKASSIGKSSGGSSSNKSSSGSSSKKSSGTVSKTTKKTATTKSTKGGSTYSNAAAKLQKAGATTGDGGLMTETEWKRRKRSGSNRAEFAYATYSDYVNSFSAWRLANPEK